MDNSDMVLINEDFLDNLLLKVMPELQKTVTGKP